MADVKVQMNDAGVKAILKHPAVGAKLMAMGGAAQAAARASGDKGASYIVTGRPGRTRFRVSVITANFAARKSEATKRNLTMALNAARGR